MSVEEDPRPKLPRHTTTEVYARLGRLETDFSGFKGEVTSKLTSIADALHGFGTQLTAVASAASRPVPMGTVFGGLAVLFTFFSGVVVLGSRGPLEDVADNKQAVSNLTIDLRDRIASQAYESGRNEERRKQADDLLARVRMLEDEDYTRPEAERDFARFASGYDKHVELIRDHLVRVDAKADANALLGTKVESIAAALQELKSEVRAALSKETR